MQETQVCWRCETRPEFLDLHRCPICFKTFCESCAISISGRLFCSQPCAEFFFHGDEDDIEEEGN